MTRDLHIATVQQNTPVRYSCLGVFCSSGAHSNTRCVIFARSGVSGPPWRRAAGTAGPPTWVPHMEAGDESLGTFRLSDKGLREPCCMCGSDRDELCVSLGDRSSAVPVRSHSIRCDKACRTQASRRGRTGRKEEITKFEGASFAIWRRSGAH